MKTELKPCPFCGSDVFVRYNGDYYARSEFWITCEGCDVEVPVDGMVINKFKNKIDEASIAMWNKRTKCED